MLIAHASAFAASMGFIFLKALQQRNVAFDNFAWIMPTALAMGFAEVYVIATVAVVGYDLGLVLSIGTGAGLGAMAAMVVHKRFVRGGR